MGDSPFSNMSDSKSIVRFVKDIERHPCLYNRKCIQYVDRVLKRQTWMHIAKRLNTTVAECKEKWRKIRTAYGRSLKPRYLNGVRVPSKPYYLASYLKFITPNDKEKRNLTGRKHFIISTNQPKKLPEIKAEVENIDESDTEDGFDDNFDGKSDPINTNNEFEQDDIVYDVGTVDIVIDKEVVNTGPSIEVHKTKETNKSCSIKNHDVDFDDIKRCSYCVNVENKPRKMFLFSVFPDIESLSDNQMRCFRRELLDLIDKCKYMPE
ncbi:uncharacterized protein LOC112058333 [Bicyclus anynana]|uniref:Uncharacterized protein LOC112058333 n=1 Tax=Bicyclus anynana TaxID=110368 RepID=A0A6J1PAN4_BICAN|nr:uncharacterized protein LOC112058333 [Bicyclus anynana]